MDKIQEGANNNLKGLWTKYQREQITIYKDCEQNTRGSKYQFKGTVDKIQEGANNNLKGLWTKYHRKNKKKTFFFKILTLPLIWIFFYYQSLSNVNITKVLNTCNIHTYSYLLIPYCILMLTFIDFSNLEYLI